MKVHPVNGGSKIGYHALDKRAAETAHALKRAAERYGLRLGPDGLKDLVKQIQQNKGEFLGRQSKRVAVWKVYFGNVELIAIYDKLRGQIITLLPPDAKIEFKGRVAQAVAEKHAK